MSRSFVTILVVLLAACVSTIITTNAAAQQTTVFVDATSTNTAAPSTSNPGNAWGSNVPYKYLQNGLQRADQLLNLPSPPAAVQVWVRGSSTGGLTYYPDEGNGITNNSRTVAFELKSKVQIYGGFAGSESQLNQRNHEVNITILSGDLQQNDTGSYATNNAGNRSDNAFHIIYGSGVHTTARLDGFRVRGGNSTGQDSSGNFDIFGGKGSGVLLQGNPAARIVRCTFIDNEAYYGGALHIDGGGPSCEGCSSNDPYIINCRILGNKSEQNGGGMCNNGGNTTLVNCAFSGNHALQRGGALIAAHGDGPPESTTILDCTFTGNVSDATVNPTGAVWAAGTLTIKNSILYGNSPSEITATSPTVQYTDVQLSSGVFSGIGNINSNPQFADANGADNTFGSLDDNVRLNCGSLAINTGSNGLLPVDTVDLDGNGATTSQTLPQDLDAAQRVIGVPTAAVDMGAYEKTYTVTVCYAEANGTCQVNVDDLLAVILSWGACSGSCPADVVPLPCKDGVVNVDDLLAVITTWFCASPGCEEDSEIVIEDAQDCMDAASQVYTPHSAQWNLAVERCISALE